MGQSRFWGPGTILLTADLLQEAWFLILTTPFASRVRRAVFRRHFPFWKKPSEKDTGFLFLDCLALSGRMLGCAMSIRLPASTCLVFLILLSAGPTWSLPHTSQTPLTSLRMEYAGVSLMSSSKFTERLRSSESLRGGSIPDASTHEVCMSPP